MRRMRLKRRLSFEVVGPDQEEIQKIRRDRSWRELHEIRIAREASLATVIYMYCYMSVHRRS